MKWSRVLIWVVGLVVLAVVVTVIVVACRPAKQNKWLAPQRTNWPVNPWSRDDVEQAFTFMRRFTESPSRPERNPGPVHVSITIHKDGVLQCNGHQAAGNEGHATLQGACADAMWQCVNDHRRTLDLAKHWDDMAVELLIRVDEVPWRWDMAVDEGIHGLRYKNGDQAAWYRDRWSRLFSQRQYKQGLLDKVKLGSALKVGQWYASRWRQWVLYKGKLRAYFRQRQQNISPTLSVLQHLRDLTKRYYESALQKGVAVYDARHDKVVKRLSAAELKGQVTNVLQAAQHIPVADILASQVLTSVYPDQIGTFSGDYWSPYFQCATAKTAAKLHRLAQVQLPEADVAVQKAVKQIPGLIVTDADTYEMKKPEKCLGGVLRVHPFELHTVDAGVCYHALERLIENHKYASE